MQNTFLERIIYILFYSNVRISFDENSNGGSWVTFFSINTADEEAEQQQKSSESDQYSLFERMNKTKSASYKIDA